MLRKQYRGPILKGFRTLEQLKASKATRNVMNIRFALRV